MKMMPLFRVVQIIVVSDWTYTFAVDILVYGHP